MTANQYLKLITVTRYDHKIANSRFLSLFFNILSSDDKVFALLSLVDSRLKSSNCDVRFSDPATTEQSHNARQNPISITCIKQTSFGRAANPAMKQWRDDTICCVAMLLCEKDSSYLDSKKR